MASLDEVPIPELARTALCQIVGQIDDCLRRILELERQIVLWHRTNEASNNLATIPGIGPITASALVASVVDPGTFNSGRHFAAWLGLVPARTPPVARTGSDIIKIGDSYIRRLLVLGSVIRLAQDKAPGDENGSWTAKLPALSRWRLTSRPTNQILATHPHRWDRR